MQIVKYEKVKATFKPWTKDYLTVAQDLIDFIRIDDLDVIHIGSTSARVGGKGIIDLSVLYTGGNLNLAIERLHTLGFQDQISDKPFPPERPRKDAAVQHEGIMFYIHIHVIESGSEEHIKQLQYKDYLLNNPLEREKYEFHKKSILADGFTDMEEYGKQKSPFVKSVINQFTVRF